MTFILVLGTEKILSLWIAGRLRMGRAVRRHPLDRIRFSVASFQDNLVELRSGLPDCPSINADLRLERQSRLYTFA